MRANALCLLLSEASAQQQLLDDSILDVMKPEHLFQVCGHFISAIYCSSSVDIESRKRITVTRHASLCLHHTSFAQAGVPMGTALAFTKRAAGERKN